MNLKPIRHQPTVGSLTEPPLEPPGAEGQLHRLPIAVLLRSKWLILACVLLALGVAVFQTWRSVPVYQGVSTLRIEEKEFNLPEVFRTMTDGGSSRLATEMEELRSRSLAAHAVDELGLQLSLVEPARGRGDLLTDAHVADSAGEGRYVLIRGADGRFTLFREKTTVELGQFAPGDRVAFDGWTFVLRSAAGEYPTIRFAIRSRADAAAGVAGGISVSQASRDVSIIRVVYSSTDPELAWRVPQALVERYIAQRQDRQTLETRSTVEFLRQQIATISEQLSTSERQLKAYRERNEVISPETEATSQVGRLVSMQTQRGLLDNERSALAQLLADVDAKAAARNPGDPSPYRRLLAFPSLLQTQAATGILQSLSSVEDERNTLLTRRTPADEDVKALDTRVEELERELRAMAATYLQGIGNQVQSLDQGLTDFRRQLRAIPERELEFARLERQPKVLEGVYTMLQTRLKEAEVSAAARDASVRVVDAAVPPQNPISPRPGFNLMAGLAAGLILGLGAAFVRQYFDAAIRTRADIRGITGLPVIGLIPRIGGDADPIALIARRGIVRIRPPSPPAPPAASKPATQGIGQRYSYTFLQTPEPDTQPELPGTPPAVAMDLQATVDKVSLTIPALAGMVAEAYGVLQTNISFSRQDVVIKTLVFTSPLSGDGKTTTVVNLAISLAQRGLRTLLIDGDLRRGIVHSVFQVSRHPGLSEVLQGSIPFERAHHRVQVGDSGVLDYLTTGRQPASEQGLVSSQAMGDLLVHTREIYDVVIVDTPPVNIITDAALLGTAVDGVVLVARSGVTGAAALSYAMEQLRHVRAPVLGVVLNDIDMQRDSAYDSAYKYMKGYEYSAREE